MIFEVSTFTKPKAQVKVVSYKVGDDLYEEVQIIDKDMGGELEETTIVKMEIDQKKSKNVKGKNKGVKRKHKEITTQKKKEISKKAYNRRVQAYKHKWKEKKEPDS